MSILRKAFPSDFELIYPLLKQFDNALMDKHKWSLFFEKYWPTEEEHIGFVLIENNCAVGFIGCVFSSRIINDKKEKFCGLSSWIVHPNYRSESILLFGEILRLKNYTITSFTSIPDAVKILEKLKFKILDSGFYWFPKNLNLLFFKHKIDFITDKAEMFNHMSDLQQIIYKDHSPFNCKHLVIKDNSSICYIIYKVNSFYKRKLINLRYIYYINRITKILFNKSFLDKEVFCAKTHYISNLELFNKYLPEIVKYLSCCNNLNGVLVDSRFFNHSNRLIRFKSVPQISLYKSNSLSPKQIDSLYSELFILDY